MRRPLRRVCDGGLHILSHDSAINPASTIRAAISFKEKEMRKKSVVAVLKVVGVLLLFGVPMFAQTTQGANAGPNTATDTDIKLLREDIRSERIRLVAANLPLTDTEATKFWPTYDEYLAEVSKIGDARLALIREYVRSYDTMTDAQANDLMKRSAALDQQFSALLIKYVPVFEKVISAKKTAKLYQIDRRLDLLINVELAANIPMVDASK
jgi:hypothetical protein